MTQTARELIHSLTSDLCPSCGGHKVTGRTVCMRCWKRLPRDRQQPLYRRVGDGYEEAFSAAMASLGVTEPRLPRVK